MRDNHYLFALFFIVNKFEATFFILWNFVKLELDDEGCFDFFGFGTHSQTTVRGFTVCGFTVCCSGSFIGISIISVVVSFGGST